MRHYIYKLSFIPKIPIPRVLLDQRFSYDGSHFLISPKPIALENQKISNISNARDQIIHVSRDFEAYLNKNEYEMLSTVFSDITDQFIKQPFENLIIESKAMVIPVFKLKDRCEWESTLEWAQLFNNPTSLVSIYKQILISLDRKNNGEKLGPYIAKNGEWINKFIHFIMGLDISVSEFIEYENEKNDKQLNNQEMVALIAALRFQEKVIQRIVRSDHTSQYYLVQSVDFDISHGSSYSNKGSIKNLDRDDRSKFKANYPLLEITTTFASISSKYEYPKALNFQHQRILEILSNRSILKQLLQRIPDNYRAPMPDKLSHIDFSFLVPFTPSLIFTGFHINKVFEQITPIAKGRNQINSVVLNLSSKIMNNLKYKFNNLKLLKIAIKDPEIFFDDANPNINNSKLIILGDAVLNLIISNAIFNTNKDESVANMLKLTSLILGGEFFRLIVDKLGFGYDYLSPSGGPNPHMTTKEAQDLIFSIFGAIYLDSSLINCYQAFKNFISTDNIKRIAETFFNLNPLGASTLNYISNKLDLEAIADFKESNHPLSYESITNAIHFEFPRDKLPLFQAAFTHSSASNYQSNEKLSFFGEVFSKFILTTIAYEIIPSLTANILQRIVHKKLNDFKKIAYKEKISTLTVVSSDFQDKLTPTKHEVKHNLISSLHGETLYAVIAAIAISNGFNVAFKYVDKVFLQKWKNSLMKNYQKEIDDPIYSITGYVPEYKQISVNGKYYTFVTIDNYAVPHVGIGKDLSSSKFDIISMICNSNKDDSQDPNLLLTKKKKSSLELKEPLQNDVFIFDKSLA